MTGLRHCPLLILPLLSIIIILLSLSCTRGIPTTTTTTTPASDRYSASHIFLSERRILFRLYGGSSDFEPGLEATLHLGEDIFSLHRNATATVERVRTRQDFSVIGQAIVTQSERCRRYYFTIQRPGGGLFRWPQHDDLKTYENEKCGLDSPVFVLYSDLLIAASYFFIPLELLYCLRKAPHLPYPWIIILFGTFIASCGMTHLISVWLPWYRTFYALYLMKAFCALVSFVTAVANLVIIPKLLQLPITMMSMEEEIGKKTASEGRLLSEKEMMTKFRKVTEKVRHTLDKKVIYNSACEQICEMLQAQECQMYTPRSICGNQFALVASTTRGLSLESPRVHDSHWWGHASRSSWHPVSTEDPDAHAHPYGTLTFGHSRVLSVGVKGTSESFDLRSRENRNMLTPTLPEGLFDELIIIPFPVAPVGLRVDPNNDPLTREKPTHGFMSVLRREKSKSSDSDSIAGDQFSQIPATSDILQLLNDIGSQIAIAVQQATLLSQDRARINQLAEQNVSLQRARQEIMVANEHRDRLAVMSHEFKTPLYAIFALTSYIIEAPPEALRNSKDSDATEVFDMLAVMHESADMLIHIVDNTLDVSKYDAQEMLLEEAPFGVLKTVESSVDVGQRQNMTRVKSTPRVNYFLEDDVPAVVIGDTTRFKQIMVNLINNAVKFTDADGEVNVFLSLAPNRPHKAENEVYLQLTVTDTGVGIPSEEIPKLFTKYAQVDASITRKYGGTGLGLAICKQIVQLMNGTIRIEPNTKAGKGTCFIVELRFLHHGENLVGSPAPTRPITEITPRILLITPWESDKRFLEQIVKWCNSEIPVIWAQSLASLSTDTNVRDVEIHGIIADFAVIEKSDQRHVENLLRFGLPILIARMLDPAKIRDSNTDDVVSPSDDEIARTKILISAAYRKAAKCRKPIKKGVLQKWIAQEFNPLRRDSDGTIMQCVCHELLLEPKVTHVEEVVVQDSTTLVTSVSPKRHIPPMLSPSALPSNVTRGPPELPTLKILLVEDNLINQLVTGKILSKLGQKYDIASNGLECIEKLKAGEVYDVIFMDISMPVLDGHRTAIRIREMTHNMKSPWIIAFSANGLWEDRLRAQESGMNEFMEKPAKLGQFRTALSEFVRWRNN